MCTAQGLSSLKRLELLNLAADSPTRFADLEALVPLRALRQLVVFAGDLNDTTNDDYVAAVQSEFEPIGRMTCARLKAHVPLMFT